MWNLRVLWSASEIEPVKRQGLGLGVEKQCPVLNSKLALGSDHLVQSPQ